MPVFVEWNDKDKLILDMRFDNHWDWEAYTAAQTRLYQLADNASGPVGLIITMPEHLTLPRDVLSVMQSKLRGVHPNIALRVVVTRNDFVRSLFRLFVTLNPHVAEQVYLVSTQDAALDVLNKQLALTAE